MGQPIKSNEIIEQNALVDFIAKGEIALDIMQKMREEFKEVAKASKKVVSGGGALKKAKDIEKFREAIDKTNAAFRETQRLEKEEVKLQAKLDASYSKTATDVAKLKLEVNRRNKQLKEEAILSSKTTGNYEKASLVLRRLKREYQNLAVVQGTNTKEAKRLAKAIQLEDARLKKIDKTIGDNFRNVGNYSNALGGLKRRFGQLAGALGLTGGIVAFGRAIRNGFRTIVDFQKANADLAGVLGTTRKQIKALTADAKRLGSSTIFTATAVSGLQKEFAKLGFSEKEILKVTEATLTLATATSTELPRSAEVVGNTLRAFQLDASQTERVVDVMTKSFNSSALDMEKFATAMRSVAPVASSANVSLEETTALLGTITSSGVDASTAGTALRNIFLELSKNGLTLDQALGKIRNSTNKNKTAFELFGKRGSAVATILATNTEETAKLEKELDKAGGTAQKVADEQMDTLTGKMAEASSAWEGFILSLESGEGVIAEVISGAIELFTNLLTNLTNLSKTSAQITQDSVDRTTRLSGDIAKSTFTTFKNFQEESEREILNSIDKISQEREKARKAGDSEQSARLGAEIAGLKLILKTRKDTEGQGLTLEEERLAVIIQLQKQSDINAKKESDALDEKKFKLEKLIKLQNDSLNASKSLTALESAGGIAGLDVKGVLSEKLTKEINSLNVEITRGAESTAQRLETTNEQLKNSIAEQTDERLKNLASANAGFSSTLAREELERRKARQGTIDKDVKENQNGLDAQAEANKRAREKEAREAEKRRQDEIKAEKLRVKTLNAIRNASDKGRILDAKEATDEAIKEQKRLGLEGKDIDTEAFIDELDFEFELRKAKELDEREFLLNQTGITEEQKRLIIIQSDARLLAIDKEKNERIIQGQDEIIEAQIEGFDKVNEVAKASADKRKKEQQELVDGIKLLATETIAFLDRISDKQLAIIDKQATKQQKRIDNLQAKAVEGRLDLTESVAEEEKRLEELEARRAKIEKQKQRRQAFITGLGILESKIKNNETGALSKTFSDLIKLSSFVTSLPTFFEGTENVSGTDASMKLNTPIDPFVVRVHPGERIMSASDNAKIGKMSNSELVEVASMYKTGFVDQPVYQQSGTDSMAIYRMTKAITDGNKKLLDKPTYLGGDFDDAREAWVLSIQKGATLEKRALKINRGY